MGKLMYNFDLFEVQNDTEIRQHLPHFSEIANWLQEEWKECYSNRIFDRNDIRENIESATLIVKQLTDGTARATIVMEFKKFFYLTEQRKASVWEDMEAQMSDGFGEVIAHRQIPNAPDGCYLEF